MTWCQISQKACCSGVGCSVTYFSTSGIASAISSPSRFFRCGVHSSNPFDAGGLAHRYFTLFGITRATLPRIFSAIFNMCRLA